MALLDQSLQKFVSRRWCVGRYRNMQKMLGGLVGEVDPIFWTISGVF